MTATQSIEAADAIQASPTLRELESILQAIDTAPIIDRLEEYRWTGRQGYSLEGMLRAFLASYALNLSNTSALVRRLQDDIALRFLCGLTTIPHRTTFSRFFSRLTNHHDLLSRAIAGLTTQLAGHLPDFGKVVAVDASVIEGYANPNRKHKTDPDANWTAKTYHEGQEKKTEWYYGYKIHMMADATHGIPVTSFTTTASVNDTRAFPPLMEQAADNYSWLRMEHVLADKGYDSRRNHEIIGEYGAEGIIPMREQAKDGVYEDIFNHEGVPICMGGQEMDFIQHDPERGNLYRCPPGGCELRNRKGIVYCDTEYWEQGIDNPRLFGPTRRASKEWKALYGMRQSVERVFKSLKQSRRLVAHCFQGLPKVGLHALLSVLVYQATALVRIMAGEAEFMRWQVRKVA